MQRWLHAFVHASLTFHLHSESYTHSSFKTVQEASSSKSSLSPQRGLDVLSLNFAFPELFPSLHLSHHILFAFPSVVMAGRSLGAGAVPHSSSYAQYRTADQGCCRHPVYFLKFKSDVDFVKLLVKIVHIQILQGEKPPLILTYTHY